MTKTEILEDLDYVRTLAEEGRNAPTLGGRFGLWWGTLLCGALCAHWMILTGKLGSGPQSLGLLWFAFGVIGGIGSFVLGKTLAGKPGASSTNNRLGAAMWNGTAILIFLYALSAGISASLGNINFAIMDTIMPVAFGLYGFNAFVMAKLTREPAQFTQSIIGFAFVPLCLFMQGKPELYLVAILGVLVTSVIPAIIALRAEPKTTV